MVTQQGAEMVQQSLELCATCSHARGEHEGEKDCLASWLIGEPDERTGERRAVLCKCHEFWPIRNQLEDGLAVREWEVGFGGGVQLMLNRRVTSEFWASLKAGQLISLSIEAVVAGKGFKQHKDWGLIETRKLAVRYLNFDEPAGRQTWQDESGEEHEYAETGEVCGQVHRGHIEPCALLKSQCDLPPGLGAATGVSWTGYS